MTVVSKRRRKLRRPDRRQQVLPAEGAQRIGHHRDADAEQQQPRVGMACLGPDAGHVHAAEKKASSPTVSSRTRAARSRDGIKGCSRD